MHIRRRPALPDHLVYPIRPPERVRLADRRAVRSGISKRRFGPIRCTVCGQRGYAHEFAPTPQGLRETGKCSQCGATNRHRQLALVLAGVVSEQQNTELRSLRGLAHCDVRIHNTETTGPIHRALAEAPRYTASEYLNPGFSSGDVVDGIMHQDLMDMSFDSASIDVLVSSDVFEHVADPYRAHSEIFRVLRPGGVHVFTIPFLETEYLDQTRASVDGEGNVTHFLEPVYHADPINPDPGALVFTYFSLEMLTRLKAIGFDTRMYWLHQPSAGIVGQEATVFAAVKPG